MPPCSDAVPPLSPARPPQSYIDLLKKMKPIPPQHLAQVPAPHLAACASAPATGGLASGQSPAEGGGSASWQLRRCRGEWREPRV